MGTGFDTESLKEIFPKEKTDAFFEALYGDASEGAYDIELVFKGEDNNRLHFEFHLRQRPGKCLACNLTYGLPEVFRRHPIIDIKGIVGGIERTLMPAYRVVGYHLGRTREYSRTLHAIPLILELEKV
jgi:hypothetical protein